jgi:hypothetical protein
MPKGVYPRTANQIETSRRLGSKQGKRNKKSGHWQRISQLPDRVANGRRSGQLASERGQIQQLGHIQGQINVVSGFLESIRTLEGSVRGGKTQGLIQGPRQVENGYVGGRWPIAQHVRWHVNCNRLNPKCKHCRKVSRSRK